MKYFTMIILLVCFQNSTPVGRWEYKEDKTIIDIKQIDGKFSGFLITSAHPERNGQNEIIRNLVNLEGKWRGEYYLYKNNRWVEASFKRNNNILYIHYDYGFQSKKMHLYLVK